jgi:hypothetical protein
MRKLNATLGLATITLLSLIFCSTTFAQQPPDNVEGNWTIYSTDTRDGGTQIKHVQIAQYGNRVTGFFEGPNQSGLIQGRIDVHHIMFKTVTRNVLTFRGQIYGNNISGLYGIHGKRAPWQAVRTTGIGVPPQAVIGYSQPAVNYSQQPAVNYSQPAAPQPVPSYAPQDAPQPATEFSANTGTAFLRSTQCSRRADRAISGRACRAGAGRGSPPGPGLQCEYLVEPKFEPDRRGTGSSRRPADVGSER